MMTVGYVFPSLLSAKQAGDFQNCSPIRTISWSQVKIMYKLRDDWSWQTSKLIAPAYTGPYKLEC